MGEDQYRKRPPTFAVIDNGTYGRMVWGLSRAVTQREAIAEVFAVINPREQFRSRLTDFHAVAFDQRG